MRLTAIRLRGNLAFVFQSFSIDFKFFALIIKDSFCNIELDFLLESLNRFILS